MREFFVLAYDSGRTDLETVSEYKLHGFDVTALWRGQTLATDTLAAVELLVRKGARSDYLANPLSWPIVSENFWSAIEPIVAKNCQLFPAPVFRRDDHSQMSGYLLINLTCTLKALADTGTSIPDMIINSAQVPDDVHMFRLIESTSVIVVSNSFVNAIWGKGLQGLALIRTKVI